MAIAILARKLSCFSNQQRSMRSRSVVLFWQGARKAVNEYFQAGLFLSRID
jgi:hypothetical protein